MLKGMKDKKTDKSTMAGKKSGSSIKPDMEKHSKREGAQTKHMTKGR